MLVALNINNELTEVNIQNREGDRRRFDVPSIPLTGIVTRESRNNYPMLRLNTVPRLEIPSQDLYSPSEFDEALGDEEMLGHVRFVLGCVDRARRETAE